MTDAMETMAMDRADSSLFTAVDARTKLAGSNRLEILMFSLGTSETFGMLGNNSYVGYLTDLKGHYPRMPLIIAETGVPSSWGIAHYATNGMHHGGANQQLQGETMLRLFHNVKDTKCGGAIDFAWIDEWFKSTWITYPLDYDIDRRILWHNVMSPEQNYGLIGFTKPTVMENWAKFCSQSTDFKNYSFRGLRLFSNKPFIG